MEEFALIRTGWRCRGQKGGALSPSPSLWRNKRDAEVSNPLLFLFCFSPSLSLSPLSGRDLVVDDQKGSVLRSR